MVLVGATLTETEHPKMTTPKYELTSIIPGRDTPWTQQCHTEIWAYKEYVSLKAAKCEVQAKVWNGSEYVPLAQFSVDIHVEHPTCSLSSCNSKLMRLGLMPDTWVCDCGCKKFLPGTPRHLR